MQANYVKLSHLQLRDLRKRGERVAILALTSHRISHYGVLVSGSRSLISLASRRVSRRQRVLLAPVSAAEAVVVLTRRAEHDADLAVMLGGASHWAQCSKGRDGQ